MAGTELAYFPPKIFPGSEDEIIKSGGIRKLNKKWMAMKPDDLDSATQVLPAISRL